MPIRILEMHIKININAAEDTNTLNSSKGADSGAASNKGNSSSNESDKDAIVSECVEQVLYILKEKLEK